MKRKFSCWSFQDQSLFSATWVDWQDDFEGGDAEEGARWLLSTGLLRFPLIGDTPKHINSCNCHNFVKFSRELSDVGLYNPWFSLYQIGCLINFVWILHHITYIISLSDPHKKGSLATKVSIHIYVIYMSLSTYCGHCHLSRRKP